MKKIYLTLVALLATVNMFSQGWPANYSGVMLQGFYWDSFSESKWTKLEAQAPIIRKTKCSTIVKRNDIFSKRNVYFFGIPPLYKKNVVITAF